MTDFSVAYRGKKVLVTGHTGFKGSWLSLWLQSLGADVVGYALSPETEPSHLTLLDLDMVSVKGDIRDFSHLQRLIKDVQPEIIFHLAAQPLVRRSYREPVETFETNVMGTVNVLEACRQTPSVRAIVNITSDKCYENREWVWGYRENDPMGGYDPYSASKGAAELVSAAYRRSYFNNAEYGKIHETLLATCRAGNVIGGGDWSEDRLIPDIVRAVTAKEAVTIRSPNATRPWQHVLDALSGYLLLGQKLLEGQSEFADAWNFGPSDEDVLTVKEMCSLFEKEWERTRFNFSKETPRLHEAGLLKLDCSKAHTLLNWRGRWHAQEAVIATAEWYRAYIETGKILSREQLKKWMDT
ncbi:CDP-glucose 4,6-dehydratase [Nitratifractor salsuginis]|uniref:CDP-glucose 4,6-dehydratase n=1 Tax=Nitratifractor salsuginis (strain DSM 16511 / JCM 12458 / E9I37-1) TaxID=749222 RepID=E6X2Z1_NITSE|nr:CDP-glucose 4,6-dehydratase [Nitratifractor salsuginis]ADV47274.1 CDP-glucose 4,6-dehydratase [Nitratifractor salsuginis DSM 16511]